MQRGPVRAVHNISIFPVQPDQLALNLDPVRRQDTDFIRRVGWFQRNRCATAAEAPGGSETVLLVEDDPDLREMTTQMLQMRGFHPLVAPDAVTAITTCRVFDGAIDVLLTDLGLPGVSGGELALRSSTRVDEKEAECRSQHQHQSGSTRDRPFKPPGRCQGPSSETLTSRRAPLEEVLDPE